jgi:hypothetical protein
LIYCYSCCIMQRMRTLQEVNANIREAQSTGADFESVIKPLNDERREIISNDRDKWEDDNYAVEIDCPIHITHKAKLFTNGHRYAGIWECEVEGDTDACPHYDVEVAEDEDFGGAAVRFYACVKCHIVVDGEPGDDDGE